MIFLAQATQPTRWIWTNLSSPELLALIAGGAAVSYAALEVIKQLGLKLIAMWFGWRTAAQQASDALELAKKNEQTNAALSRTLPTTPDPQPQDAAIIQESAATPPKAE
jgi:hypothetical protein